MEARASFPPDLESAAAARHFAERVLDDWGCHELREAARLLISELVVNTVLHAGSGSDLRLDHDGSRLRVEVRDDSAEAPVRRGYSPSAPTGRGMLILDGLADRWGVDVHEGGLGKTVWFELAPDGVPARPGGPGARGPGGGEG